MNTTGLEHIRERMAEYLREREIKAVTAWPEGERTRVERPVVVVSLRKCQAEPAGFQNYLGERYDEASGFWEEVYGRRAEITFGLDIWAPVEMDGEQVQAAFDALAGALAAGGPEGLTVKEFSCGETDYDREARLMKRPAQAVCQVWLYAVKRPGGLFEDFEIRGGLKR